MSDIIFVRKTTLEFLVLGSAFTQYRKYRLGTLVYLEPYEFFIRLRSANDSDYGIFS